MVMKELSMAEKELLLKDLCTRSMYGVKVSVVHHDKSELFFGKEKTLVGVLYAVFPSEERVIVDELSETIAPINVRHGGFLIEEDCVKPYLRPMSSMTEEEENEYDATFDTIYVDGHYDSVMTYKSYDWLNAHHFDYRGLIGKSLALEAPEGMYDVK